jgi:hypothetical protein
VSSALRFRTAETPVSPITERILYGHSGARITLLSDGRDSFVRKTAANADTSARLQAQADKQHAFWMFGLPFPKVRSQAMDAAGIGSFDMNYIPGRTIADAVANGGTYDAALVIKAVERLMQLFTMGAGGSLPARLFADKIRDVSLCAEDDPALRHAMKNCAQMLLLKDWSGIPESPCHGDLTLENILLTAGGSIAFIDCDESFASSWWLDFGKLFQDLDGHWCIRALYDEEGGARDGIRRLNAVQKLDVLAAHFRLLAASLDGRLVARLPQLAALGLFRAIPYAQSAVRGFICRQLQQVLERQP